MGDLVLTEDEVNPVMSAVLTNGLDVTALHNHFFWEQPRIYFMHVHGMGTAADLATRVKPALDLFPKPRPLRRRACGGLTGGRLNSAALATVSGMKVSRPALSTRSRLAVRICRCWSTARHQRPNGPEHLGRVRRDGCGRDGRR